MVWLRLRRGDVDAVVLDVGGVLVLPDPAHLHPVFIHAGLSPSDQEIHEAHYHGVAAMDSIGRVDWSKYFYALARSCGARDESCTGLASLLAEASRRADHWRRPAPGAIDGLRALQATGVGLAVVSNSDGTVEESLGDLGICQVGPGPGVPVEIIIDSHVVGLEKPDPAIFALAIDACGVRPDRAVYVGDTVQFDVVGARRAGLVPVHFDPPGRCPGTTDHLHMPSLSALASQLGRDPRRA